MIYYSAASFSLKKKTTTTTTTKNKKKTDLKGILSDALCLSEERKVIFPLRNVNSKDYIQLYISCQFVEPTHLKHTENVTFIVDNKKTQGKAITKFCPMSSNVQHLNGLMTFSDN